MAKESNLSWDKEGRGEMEMRFHISFCDFRRMYTVLYNTPYVLERRSLETKAELPSLAEIQTRRAAFNKLLRPNNNYNT